MARIRTTALILILLTAFSLQPQCQILGIFEQGAEELSEYGQQIAALELLLSRQQNGYQIIESGLTAISNITGIECTLHQNYYSSLVIGNPAITRSPDFDEFLSVQSQISTALATALTRWRQSGYLSSPDLDYITRVCSAIESTMASQLSAFNTLISSNNFNMTDDQRIRMISQAYSKIKFLYFYSQSFIDEVDLLILNRKVG
jgi:hypothetical protein